MPVKPFRMRQRATISRERHDGDSRVKRDSFSASEVPADRLQGAPMQRQYLTGMALYPWKPRRWFARWRSAAIRIVSHRDKT